MRKIRLAPGRGIMDAFGSAGLVDRVEAVAGADARPDPVLPARRDLFHQVRIGDLRARHTDEVEKALADGVPGSGNVRDPCGMHDGHVEPALDTGREVEERGGRRAHGRDGPGKRGVAADGALDGADEVDAVIDVPAGRGDGIGFGEPSRAVFVEGHADADHEFRPDRAADRPDHSGRERGPAVRGTAVFVIAVVGGRRQESVEQVAVGLEFDAVESGILAPFGGRGEVADYPIEVPRFGDLGHRPVRGFAFAGRIHQRQPVSDEIACATAQMSHLAHHCRALGVHVVGQEPQPGNYLIPIQFEIPKCRRAIARDDCRAADHRQPDAAACLFHVITAIPVGGHSVFGVRGLVRCADDAIAQLHVADMERLQQRVLGGHTFTIARKITE